MSRYNLTVEEEKYEQLVDLARVYYKTITEVMFLEAHLKSIKVDIIELMEELGIDRIGKLKLTKKETVFVSVEGLAKDKAVVQYAVVTINEHATIAKMYQDNINYTIAQQMVRKAIALNKTHSYEEKDIEI